MLSQHAVLKVEVIRIEVERRHIAQMALGDRKCASRDREDRRWSILLFNVFNVLGAFGTLHGHFGRGSVAEIRGKQLSIKS